MSEQGDGIGVDTRTDMCTRCLGDCGMSNCPECGGCENTGPGMTFRTCPACEPEPEAIDDEYDDYADGDYEW